MNPTFEDLPEWSVQRETLLMTPEGTALLNFAEAWANRTHQLMDIFIQRNGELADYAAATAMREALKQMIEEEGRWPSLSSMARALYLICLFSPHKEQIADTLSPIELAVFISAHEHNKAQLMASAASEDGTKPPRRARKSSPAPEAPEMAEAASAP